MQRIIWIVCISTFGIQAGNNNTNYDLTLLEKEIYTTARLFAEDPATNQIIDDVMADLNHNMDIDENDATPGNITDCIEYDATENTNNSADNNFINGILPLEEIDNTAFHFPDNVAIDEHIFEPNNTMDHNDYHGSNHDSSSYAAPSGDTATNSISGNTQTNSHNSNVKHQKHFVCQTCGKSFAYKSNLNRHQKTVHEGRRAFVCQTCGTSIKQKNDLTEHQKKKHSGKQPFVCQTCGYSFTHKWLLNRHQKETHEGQQFFICQTCGKSFAHKPHLTRHQQAVHKDQRLFTCQTCGKSFTRKDSLTLHQTTHSDKQPFVCNVCYKPYKWQSSLNRHIQKEHPEYYSTTSES